MRKKVYGRKFSRETDSRKAMFRALSRAMAEHGKIKTTKSKALALQPDLDSLASLVTKETLESKRRILARSGNDREVVAWMMARKSDFGKRESGFTRISALPPRRGDNVEMVTLEWVDQPKVQEEKKDTKSKK